jgi:hypothetical protein
MYTTDCNYFNITNYNNVQEGYYRWTGCTGIVSVTPIDPLDSHFVCASDLYAQDCGAPLTVVYIGLCPSVTPTPSFTPTPTPTNITQTPTPTPTITPTVTQTSVQSYNLWSAGYFQNACYDAGYGPADTLLYSVVPFSSLRFGDYVYGNASLTIPPRMSGNIISNGAIWIQVNPGSGMVINNGICG